MLTKILFTALVVAVVYVLYRFRMRPPQRGTAALPKPAATPVPVKGAHSRLGRIAAYSLVALIIAISSVFYYLHWREQHTVVTIRVIDGRGGNATVYKAYKKSITGSRFESLDGRTVILGEAERVEMIEGD